VGQKPDFFLTLINFFIPQVCPVCFDAWSNSGSHRVVSLKCGHLFGQSCIERWVHSGGKGARCPQCNEAAQKKDIRPIYVRNLKVKI
jgi:E3 ubiquitin-protein ligase RFWD3